jgi:hypothetical protein
MLVHLVKDIIALFRGMMTFQSRPTLTPSDKSLKFTFLFVSRICNNSRQVSTRTCRKLSVDSCEIQHKYKVSSQEIPANSSIQMNEKCPGYQQSDQLNEMDI